MRKERNKSKIWRTPKEKFGLSEISFHVRCLLNSDCSLSRVLYGQVSVLEVLWETVQWCTHWNQGHLSFSASNCHFGDPWRFFSLICMTQTGHRDIGNIHSSKASNSRNVCEKYKQWSGSRLFHYEGSAVFIHNFYEPSCIHSSWVFIQNNLNSFYSKSLVITSWVWDLPELWE